MTETPRSYDIQTIPATNIADFVNNYPIREELKDSEQAHRASFLADLREIGNSLGSREIVPQPIFDQQMIDLVSLLLNPSLAFNKLWAKNGRLIGFLVATTKETDQSLGQLSLQEDELYIKYFGFLPDQDSPIGLIKGNIDKIIAKARKQNYRRISFHGFNQKLNQFFIRRFDFKQDDSKGLNFDDLTIPYIYLDLTEQDGQSQDESPAEHNRQLDQLVGDTIVQLSHRGISLNPTQREVLERKLDLFLSKKSQHDLNAATLADAIVEIPDFLDEDNNLGLKTLLELHFKQSAQIRREKIELTGLEPKLLVEDDDYCLFDLFTGEQIIQEGADMDNCLDDSDHYINAVKNGNSKILSFRDKQGNRLVSIEYDLKTRELVQAEKRSHKSIAGEEPWFANFLKLLSQLKTLQPPIIIDSYPALKSVRLNSGNFLLSDGQIVSQDDLVQRLKSGEAVEIIKGSTIVPEENTDEDVVDKLCAQRELTLDLTKLRVSSKNKITTIAGNLIDSSTDAVYSSLTSIGGYVKLSEGASLKANALTSIGGSVELHEEVSLEANALTSIGGDVKLSEGASLEANALTSIGGNVWLSRGARLEANVLTSIGGEVELYSGASLEANSLTSIGGNVWLSRRARLEANVLTSVGGRVGLDKRVSLEANSLASIGGDVKLGEGASLEANALTSIGGEVELYSGASLEANALTSIGGYVKLSEGASLKANALTSIGGSVELHEEVSLEANALTSIGGEVELYSGASLEANSLTSIGGNVWLSIGARLEANVLTSVGGRVGLDKGVSLEANSLASIGGSVWLLGEGTSLKANALTSVGGSVELYSGASLEAINLKDFKGRLKIAKGAQIKIPKRFFLKVLIARMF